MAMSPYGPFFVFQVNQGNDEAITFYYETYEKILKSRIGSWLYRTSCAEIEDVFVETFVRLVNGCRALDFDNSSARLLAWLMTVAHNYSVECNRKERPRIEWEKQTRRELERGNKVIDAGTEASAADKSERNERIERMKRAISKLPFELQVAISFQMYSEYTYLEFADHLGLTFNELNTRVSAAKRELKKLLREFKE